MPENFQHDVYTHCYNMVDIQQNYNIFGNNQKCMLVLSMLSGGLVMEIVYGITDHTDL